MQMKYKLEADNISITIQYSLLVFCIQYSQYHGVWVLVLVLGLLLV